MAGPTPEGARHQGVPAGRRPSGRGPARPMAFDRIENPAGCPPCRRGVDDGVDAPNRTKALCVLLDGLALLKGVGPAHAAPSAAEQAAHDAYVAAINSNDLDTLAADLTDDVVFQSPGEPQIVGK